MKSLSFPTKSSLGSYCSFFFILFLLGVTTTTVAFQQDDDDNDKDVRCSDWVQNGECIGKNEAWMKQHCSKSCKEYKRTIAENCDFWAKSDECKANPNFMWKHCSAACTEHSSLEEENNDDDDEEKDYGISIGYDGLPFHINSVKERISSLQSSSKDNGGTSCYYNNATAAATSDDVTASSSESSDTNNNNDDSSCVWPPSIVKLPDNYPAKLTLAPPLPNNNNNNNNNPITLDELHERGELTYATYMRPANSGRGVEGVAVKLVNFSGRRLKKMWDDGTAEGAFNGEISGGIGSRSVLMTYPGHTFKFVDSTTGELYRKITMRADVHYIVFQPPTSGNPELRQRVLSSNEYLEAKREEKFMADYYDHYGYPWLARYGRPAPVLNMWPANYLGQTHTVESSHGYWICDEPDSNDYNPEKCHSSQESVTLNLTVASYDGMNGPRVFVIPELMSEVECDHILRLGVEVVRESMVGSGGSGFKSKSRTSSTGWLSRRHSPILETMQRRFADVLGLDESRLVEGDLAEQLQVVQYQHGQKYNPHHDFADSSGVGYGQRFLTLLLYVVVPAEGGHTSFPKAFDGRGVRIKPPKRGGAVLFYSMLPDGNGDDRSLHAGEVVERNRNRIIKEVTGDNIQDLNNGNEKWVCNLWIWDPHRSG